jgi:hypothetical protein
VALKRVFADEGEGHGEEKETEFDPTVESDSEENVEAAQPSIVRTPRHDSIVEGFGNFLSDSVVLDAAFTEPDFKALQRDEVTPLGNETDTEEPAKPVKPEGRYKDGLENEIEDAEKDSKNDLEDEPKVEAVGNDSEVEEKQSDPATVPPLALSLKVVAPGELDPDEVVPAAIVAPSLIDDEQDTHAIELSELGMAGLSVLSANDGEAESASLLDNLADEQTDDRELEEGQNMDRFGSLDDDSEAASTGADAGFTVGNSALVRHRVSCPACHQTLKIQNRYLGIEGRCPGCSEMIVAKCMVSGLVIAELAKVEAPKFFERPDIEPGDIWGGTRLAAGGGLAAEPEEDSSVESEEPQGRTKGVIESDADRDGQIPVSEGPLKLEMKPEPGQAGTESSESGEDSTASAEPVDDPFSTPSRLPGDQSNEADGIWGPGIGKTTS